MTGDSGEVYIATTFPLGAVLHAGVCIDAPMIMLVTLHRIVLAGRGIAVRSTASVAAIAMLPLVVPANAVAGLEIPRRPLDLNEIIVVAGTEGRTTIGPFEALQSKVLSVFVAHGNHKSSQVSRCVQLLATTALAVCLTW